ncbi:MAG TPA: T9SS type A sorting domain-containing protein [Puia sp.]|nr:T9SS type A sorting domain-containing protein [Puia sp.]
MRPRRIQLSGWATTLLKLLIGASFLVPRESVAQCPSGFGVQTVTYSSTLSGSGSDAYDISLPQYFSSSGYTLIGASVNVYLTTTATVTFQNGGTTTQSFNPAVGRSDDVTMNGVDITGGNGSSNLPHTNLGVAGSPTDTKTYSGVSVFNNYNIINYSIDNSDPSLNDFQGTGGIAFHYTTATYVNFVPTVVTNNPIVTDNFTFSVTYTFCQPTSLSSNIITFTATRENDQTAVLNWMVENEEAGRKYNVEVSTDGVNFTAFATLPSDPSSADATYSDHYSIQQGTRGKLFFRVRQININGESGYSPVRTIDLNTGTASGFSIYPNPPSDYLNLVFPSSGQGWQVDILSADGSLVQRNYYSSTNTGRLNFQRKLSTGTYFTRATDLQTAQSYVAPFVIH